MKINIIFVYYWLRMDQRQIGNDKQIDYKALYQQQKLKVKALQDQIEEYRIRLKKISQPYNKSKICSKCMVDISPVGVSQIDSDKKTGKKMQLLNFAQEISEKMKKTNESGGTKKKSEAQELASSSFDSQSLSKSISFCQNLFPMIENFTIFGIPESNMKNQNNQLHQGQLLYSYNNTPSNVDKQANKLVFPSGLILKKIVGQKAKDKAIEMMSFSYSNLKSFILRFKCQQNVNQQQYEKNQFLNDINPAKSLFCLCIGISDYTVLQKNQKNQKKAQQTISMKQLYSSDDLGRLKEGSVSKKQEQKRVKQLEDPTFGLSQSQNLKQSKQSINSSQLDETQIYLSQRVFCISSYYPFFTFYEEILRSLLNIIKVQRLMIYKQYQQNLLQSDSRFQLLRIQGLMKSCILDLNSHLISYKQSYDLKLINSQKITLQTQRSEDRSYYVMEWVFSIMSMFTLESFIDVLTLIMLEDRVVFVSNNSHILTYTIYLFTTLLIKPFVYAFEVISIIPDEDFLGAPFPVVYGMLRKRKYVEENILKDYKNTYIFLTPEKVDIVYTQDKKDLLKFRSSKLKSQLSSSFKDLKKHRNVNLKSPKYHPQNLEYNFTSTPQERKSSSQIVIKTTEYIQKEIISIIPDHSFVNQLKNGIQINGDRDEHTILMERIKKEVRPKIKDPFTQRLLDTQMMSNFICK